MNALVLFGLEDLVLVAEAFVGDDGIGVVLHSGEALVLVGKLVREEEAAVVCQVQHPSAYGAGPLGLILHKGDEGPCNVYGIHQEGKSATVYEAALEAADLIVSPLSGGDAPAVTAVGSLAALEHPVKHLAGVEAAALLCIQAGGGVDSHGEEDLIETTFLLGVKGGHGGFGALKVAGVSKLAVCAVKHPGVAAGGVLLLGDPVVAALHLGVIEVCEIVVSVKHFIGRGKLLRHRAHYFIGPVHARENLAHSVEEDVGIDVVPPVTAVTAAKEGNLRAGVVHHNIPPVVSVEVVLGHLHPVVAVLGSLVDAVEAGADKCVKDVKALVELSAVVVGALAGVLHCGVEAEGHLAVVAAGAVHPDHGTCGKGALEVIDICVKVKGLLMPVKDLVGLGHCCHKFHAGNAHLLHGGAPGLFRSVPAGCEGGNKGYYKVLFHLLPSISLIMFLARGRLSIWMAPTITRA